MGRRVQPPTEVAGDVSAEQEMRWVSRFLRTSELGSRAARISAEIDAARTVPAKWSVIESHGLTAAVERHVQSMRAARVRWAEERAGAKP